DPTNNARIKKRMALFPTERSVVTPLRSVSFEAVRPLEDRALGRLLHLTGTVQSGIVHNAVWIKADGGRRILVRFDPAPPPGALSAIANSGRIAVDGYLTRIARAEFRVWTEDSLHVVIPRPEPGVKFGDVPDSNFVRVDSLFVKDYYLSVRPDGIRPPSGSSAPFTAPRPSEADAGERRTRPEQREVTTPTVPVRTAPETTVAEPALPAPDTSAPPPR
ncbi:MAG TPA: hypothetical protein VFH27_13280, partial [Longimicrobiaceae bacterium]|nr:hypothetical protein [Longimicrobiaceae bacterium]